MAAMQSRSEPVERLLVGMETSCGSGEFSIDSRLRVDEVWQRSDDAVSRAVLSVLLDDSTDSEDIRRTYHPDRRLVIMTEHADPLQRHMLFEGYVPVQSSRWDGRADRESEQYVFEAEHVWERFSKAQGAWIYGRHMRSGAIEDGLASDWLAYRDKSEHYTACPCIFNPDGVCNRAIEPVHVTDESGGSRLVHIFAPDGVPAAVPWTFATALRYLAWFYLSRHGLVHEGNIFDATESLVAGMAGPSDALRDALVREPASLVCEASSLVEALALWGEAAGLHITAGTINERGYPKTQLRVWSPRAGALRRLYLVRSGRHEDGTPRYDATGKSAREVLAENNTYRGQVTWDHRKIVNNAVVIGDVKCYELTVPLWPGWLPVVGLDDVSEPDRAAAKQAALLPEDIRAMGDQVFSHDWYRRYHSAGDLYPLHADVGRLWVLNEDGRCDGAHYNRHAPFDAYAPFDFASVLSASRTRCGRWTRRPRPFRPTLSVGVDGRSLGVWVELSFDGGASWNPARGAISVLKDRGGIQFECDNPTQVSPPDTEPQSQNMWYALVDRTFRVRVTAVIEGDDRLTGAYGPAGLDAPTAQVHTAVLWRPHQFKLATRDAGWSVLYTTLQGGKDERDDTSAADVLARWMARSQQDRQVRVSPMIPWIETNYAIGERIAEIKGRGLAFATTVGTEMQYPAIIERRFVLRDGRYETTLSLSASDLPERVV